MTVSSRRDFLSVAALPSLCGSLAGEPDSSTARWRGFNLQEKFTDRPDEWARVDPEWGRRNEPFVESDFEWMAQWGFNFVRLPMSYRCWTNARDPFELREPVLKQIDEAVAWGRRYGIHVCLNFHRAPGFCINAAYSPEPWNLWTDSEAQEVFAFQWAKFAERYKSSPNLSFNLINEPNRCTSAQYAAVMRQGIQAVRRADADRMVMIDGMFGEAIGPVAELADVPNAIHATRGYAPFKLTHYLAPWAGEPREKPGWPLKKDGTTEWDRQVLKRWCIDPWEDMQRKGVRVFVGEWGCWNRTPHDVALSWMRDFLTLWKQARWGWALWCFRGSFGILDSQRPDVRYESWRGHKLDRKMLELLREF